MGTEAFLSFPVELNQRITDLQRLDMRMNHYPTQLGYQPLGSMGTSDQHIKGCSLNRASDSLCQESSSPPLPPPPPASILASTSHSNSQSMEYDDCNSNSSTLASFSFKEPSSVGQGTSDPSSAVQHLFNRKSLHHHPISILQSSASTTNLNLTPMSSAELSLLSVSGNARLGAVVPGMNAMNAMNASLLGSGGDSNNNNSGSAASSSSVSASSSGSGGATGIDLGGSFTDPTRLQFLEQLIYFKKMDKPHDSSGLLPSAMQQQQPPSS